MSSLGTSHSGDDVAMESCNGSSNQTWDVVGIGSGHWEVRNQTDGFCVNDYRGIQSQSNAQNLVGCGSTSNDHYILYHFGVGFKMQNVDPGGGGGECLSSYGYTLYGSHVLTANCNSSTNQMWGVWAGAAAARSSRHFVSDRHSRRAHAAGNGYQTLKNHGANDMCMSSGGQGAGGWLEDYQCNNSANQTWDLFATQWPFFDGISNKGNGLCLNNYHGLTSDNTPQNMWACNPLDFKQNYSPSAQNGGFEVRTNTSHVTGGALQPSTQCLSSFGYTLDASYVKTSSCNSSKNQTWGSAPDRECPCSATDVSRRSSRFVSLTRTVRRRRPEARIAKLGYQTLGNHGAKTCACPQMVSQQVAGLRTTNATTPQTRPGTSTSVPSRATG